MIRSYSEIARGFRSALQYDRAVITLSDQKPTDYSLFGGLRVLALRIVVMLLAIGFVAPVASARQNRLTSRQGSVQISSTGLYQRYEENGVSVSQTSFPLSVSVPLSSGVALRLVTSTMNASGDNLESLSGLSDTQLIASYENSLGSGSIVISAGVNLPSGKRELSIDEFETLVLISQTAYDFTVPILGQGFGFSPTMTWAVPIGSDTAIGLGVAYHLRGRYKPIEGLSDDYLPGDELLLTGGIDARLNNSTALSLDVSHSIYSADRLGNVDIFDAGNKTTASIQYRRVRGFDEFRLLAVYRTRAESTELVGRELISGGGRAIPNQTILRASYGMRLKPMVSSTFLLEGRFFTETTQYPTRSMLDLGILPSLRLSPTITAVARFVYTAGTISGFTTGFGLSAEL